MEKKELIKAALEELGYIPIVDNDGDIFVRYQMKTIYFMTNQDEEPFVTVLLPQFADVNEGEETLTLAICNKVTRDVRLAKVYIDQTLKNVSATCEFYYTDMDSLKDNVDHALNILGMIRSAYLRSLNEAKGRRTINGRKLLRTRFAKIIRLILRVSSRC